jgi:hypothetical protein
MVLKMRAQIVTIMMSIMEANSHNRNLMVYSTTNEINKMKAWLSLKLVQILEVSNNSKRLDRMRTKRKITPTLTSYTGITWASSN